MYENDQEGGGACDIEKIPSESDDDQIFKNVQLNEILFREEKRLRWNSVMHQLVSSISANSERVTAEKCSFF